MYYPHAEGRHGMEVMIRSSQIKVNDNDKSIKVQISQLGKGGEDRHIDIK